MGGEAPQNAMIKEANQSLNPGARYSSRVNYRAINFLKICEICQSTRKSSQNLNRLPQESDFLDSDNLLDNRIQILSRLFCDSGKFRHFFKKILLDNPIQILTELFEQFVTIFPYDLNHFSTNNLVHFLVEPLGIGWEELNLDPKAWLSQLDHPKSPVKI